MNYFRDKFPHFFTIAVFASKQVRWAREHKAYGGDQASFERDDSRDAGDHEPLGDRQSSCVWIGLI